MFPPSKEPVSAMRTFVKWYFAFALLVTSAVTLNFSQPYNIGAFVSGGNLPAGTQPDFVTINPNGGGAPGTATVISLDFAGNTLIKRNVSPNGHLLSPVFTTTGNDPNYLTFAQVGTMMIYYQTNHFDSTVTGYTGDPTTGNLTPWWTMSAGGFGPVGVYYGDLNGDGNKDIAVLNQTSGNIAVFLGTGGGSFGPPSSIPVGQNPTALVLGDFNGDGKKDFAVTVPPASGSSGSVKILLGNGNGTFGSPSSFPVGPNPMGLTVGDFNGDGKLDIAVADATSGNISILLGKGDGTFQPAVNFVAGTRPVALVAGDFNNDGKLDLAVANSSSNNVSLLYGNGDGTFQSPINFNVGTNPVSIAAADLNGDGRLDIFTANFGSGDISELLNTHGCPAGTLFQSSLPDGGVSLSYNQSVTPTTPPSSTQFFRVSGALPPGLSLSTGGILSGTPTQVGTYTFSVTGFVAGGCPGNQNYTMKIHDVTANLSLTATGAGTFTTFGSTGPVQAGYATVLPGGTGSKSISEGQTAITSNPPYGTAVFSFTENGVVVSEAGVPASPPTTHAKIFIDFRSNISGKSDQEDLSTLSVDTGLAIVNTNSTTANAIYTLRDTNGQNPIVGNGTLAPHVHRAKFIDQLSDIAPNFVLPANFSSITQFGTLEISSDQPLSILALRLTTNQRGDSLLTSTPIADLTKALGSSAVNFSQLADGGGFKTAIVLLNTSGTAETGTMQIRADNGTPLAVIQQGGSGTPASSYRYNIPAGGVFLFSTDGSPAGISAGSVQVVPDPGTLSPVGAGIFSFKPGAVLVTESGVPAAIPTTHARIYVDESGGHDTGLAIANPGSSPINVTVNAFHLDGTTPAGSSLGPIALSANGHTAAFVGQMISGLPAGFTGVLDISSSSPFVALTLRELINSRGDPVLTTFPIADFNQIAPAPIIFPQIADGGGFVTQFIMLDAGTANNMTISFFGDDGSPLALNKAAH
ncbi:MAG: VCBS repeat-containing protein [Acidobacteriia bacterium]|nr:VCBS repeat-containing protein [Terriglobia bacterium]